MPFKLNYDIEESGTKVSAVYISKSYSKLINSMLFNNKSNTKNQNLEIQISKTDTTHGVKYQSILKNIFFFNMFNRHITVDVELSKNYKFDKLVNFDISPKFKLSFTCLNPSLIVSYKAYKIQAIKNQSMLEDKNFLKVLPSLLPYTVNQVSIEKKNIKKFEFLDLSQFLIYKAKIGFGRIKDYEDFLKMSIGYKLNLTIPVKSLFNLSLSYENHIKKSITTDKSPFKNDKHHYYQSHVLTNNECYSKLLGVNLLSKENEVDNGFGFYIHSLLNIRLNNIVFLKDYQFLNMVEPYFGIETVTRPIKNGTSFIFTYGLSLNLSSSIYIDFMFRSDSLNCIVDPEKIKKFRMGIEISNYLD